MRHAYELQIHTSDLLNAGTNANVFATLIGSKASTPELKLESASDPFEQDALDLFRLEGLEDLGDVTHIRIRHDGTHPYAGWHLDYAMARRTTDGAAFLAPFGRWLAHGEGDGRLDVTRPTARLLPEDDYLDHGFDSSYAFGFTDHFTVPFALQGFGSGYSGGMSAAALARFREKTPAPESSDPPAADDDLFRELSARQSLSLMGRPEILPKILAFQGAPDTSNPLQMIPTIGDRTFEDWQEGLKPHLLSSPTLALLFVPDQPGRPPRVHQVLVTGYRYYEETRDLILTAYDPSRPRVTALLAFCFHRRQVHGRYLADGKPIRGFFWNEATSEAVNGVPIARPALTGAPNF